MQAFLPILKNAWLLFVEEPANVDYCVKALVKYGYEIMVRDSLVLSESDFSNLTSKIYETRVSFDYDSNPTKPSVFSFSFKTWTKGAQRSFLVNIVLINALSYVLLKYIRYLVVTNVFSEIGSAFL